MVGERCETVAFFFSEGGREERGKREVERKGEVEVSSKNREARSLPARRKEKKARPSCCLSHSPSFRYRSTCHRQKLSADEASIEIKERAVAQGAFQNGREREKETNFVFRFLVFFFFFFFFFFFLSSHPDSFRDLESHAVCVHASTRDSSAEREELYFAALLHCFETQKEKKKRKSNEKVKARKTKKAQNFSPLSLSLSFFLLFNASQRPRGPAEPQQKGEEKHKQRRQRQAPDRALKVQAPAQEERRSDWSCRSSSSG